MSNWTPPGYQPRPASSTGPTRNAMAETGVGRGYRRDVDIPVQTMVVRQVGRTVDPGWGRPVEQKRDLIAPKEALVSVRHGNLDPRATGTGSVQNLWSRASVPAALPPQHRYKGMRGGEGLAGTDWGKILGIGALGLGLAVLGFVVARRLRAAV